MMMTGHGSPGARFCFASLAILEYASMIVFSGVGSCISSRFR